MLEQPVNKAFNAATMHIAGRLFPRGWEPVPVAPETLESVQLEASRSNALHCPFRVFDGASDRTAFADEECNWAFRAWHDWTHERYEFPFTIEGETHVAAVQASHLFLYYGDSEATVRMVAQLFAEVCGQVQYEAVHGSFPTDQRAFVSSQIPVYLGAARAFLRIMRLGTRSGLLNPSEMTDLAINFATQGRIAPDLTRFAPTVFA